MSQNPPWLRKHESTLATEDDPGYEDAERIHHERCDWAFRGHELVLSDAMHRASQGQSLQERLATMTPEEFREACRKTAEGDRTHRAERLAEIESFLLDNLRLLEEDEED